MTALHIRPATADKLDRVEHRRKLKQQANERYRNRKRGEVERLKQEVQSLLATLRTVSGLLAAHA
jgi:hypothetical protein